MNRRKALIATAAVAGGVVLAGGGAAFAVFNAPLPPYPDPPPLPGRLTPAQMHADIAAFAQTLVEVGADPFATTSRAAFDRARAEADVRCSSPLGIGAFYLAIAELLASLNDGHVGFGDTPYDWYLYAGHRGFPLHMSIDADDTLVVFGDAAAPVPRGSTIDAIGDRSAADLVRHTVATTGGQTSALRRLFGRPASVLYALDGARAEYRITFTPPRGATRTVALPALTLRELNARNAEHDLQPYAFHTTHDDIAVIEYNKCIDAPRFDAFLHDAFTRIRAARPRAVVVDIRRNGGGSDRVNERLWPYITQRPYGSPQGSRCRASARLKREYGIFAYARLYDVALFARDGTIVDDAPSAKLKTPPDNPLRYPGPAYMLIGPRTFSSALNCALIAHDYGLATLVGEETAEPVNSTGEVYYTALPNSHLVVGVTTKVFYSLAHPPREGVKPQIVAKRTMRDIALNRDPGLDAIRARLG
ncbi:MAG TPA: S41 family peptidase [Candidatus Elarobacter sp.]|nr:S41 family peptidase [Candidatus Elarobacter sp.]